jgi:hypothetical protein
MTADIGELFERYAADLHRYRNRSRRWSGAALGGSGGLHHRSRYDRILIVFVFGYGPVVRYCVSAPRTAGVPLSLMMRLIVP